MRLTLTFVCDSYISLPFSYNQLIQAFIYSSLDKKLGDFLHNKGYEIEKRKFKLFTFSRIFGKIKKEEEHFKIYSPFRIIVSSPENRILENLAENLVKKDQLKIGKNEVYLESINVHFTPPITSSINIKMLSPLTIYSTLKKGDGSRKTYYYSPMEKEFSELIEKNLIKKFQAYYKYIPQKPQFNLYPIKVSKSQEKIILYKNFVIKGWMGTYKITGNPQLIKLGYEAGIGAKNSQGFGCFEILDSQAEI